MKQPEVGAALVYTRIENGNEQSYDATLLGFEALKEGEQLPSAHLVFLNPATAPSFIGGVDWWRAFEHVFSVPFAEEGDHVGHHSYFDLKADVDRFSTAMYAALEKKRSDLDIADRAVLEQQSANADLQFQIATLTRRNEELDSDLASAKAENERLKVRLTENASAIAHPKSQDHIPDQL